jgi:hypothetical protein
MAREDADVRDREGVRRLDVLHLAQLQRLAPQQPREPGPAGDAEDDAQEQEAQIGARKHGVEELGVRLDPDLHHQHGGRDQ